MSDTSSLKHIYSDPYDFEYCAREQGCSEADVRSHFDRLPLSTETAVVFNAFSDELIPFYNLPDMRHLVVTDLMQRTGADWAVEPTYGVSVWDNKAGRSVYRYKVLVSDIHSGASPNIALNNVTGTVIGSDGNLLRPLFCDGKVAAAFVPSHSEDFMSSKRYSPYLARDLKGTGIIPWTLCNELDLMSPQSFRECLKTGLSAMDHCVSIEPFQLSIMAGLQNIKDQRYIRLDAKVGGFSVQRGRLSGRSGQKPPMRLTMPATRENLAA